MRAKNGALAFLLVAVMTLGMAQSVLGGWYATPKPEDLFGLQSCQGDQFWITVTLYYEVNPRAYCLDGMPPGANDTAVKDMYWGIRMQTSKKPEVWEIFTGRAHKDLIDCTLFPEHLQELCEEIKSNLHPGINGIVLCFVEDLDFEKNIMKTAIKNQIIIPNFGDVPFVFSDAKGFAYEGDESKPIFLTVDVQVCLPK